ncbi:MAG: DNA repair protein RecN [Alphaproteobacteria bacterium]|nr:DNA repair protein RecN [Alphaproteobacteria bacterium]
MLTRLVISNVVLIEKLALSFDGGLNVFTGETGAGKSIVLDALGLALGGRSDAGLVRAGAGQASVTAEFSLNENHPVFSLAREQGLDAGNPILLRRVVGQDGKSRAFFNDQPIGVGLLRQFGETLLEIHGQFDTQGLLNAGTHRALLDSFGRLSDLCAETVRAFAAWKEAVAEEKVVREAHARAMAEESFLRGSVDDLTALDPHPGEAETLAAERATLQHREKIAEALTSVLTLLDGERGAVSSLAQAAKAMARVADKAPGLSDVLGGLDRALNEATEASQAAGHFFSELDSGPDALQKLDDRLFALRAAARKHNVPVDSLQDVLEDFSARLALLTDESARLAQCAAQADQAFDAYRKQAERLSAKRRLAAKTLEKEVNRELPPLKLDQARFAVDILPLDEAQWGAEGTDRVMFLATTNKGSLPGPLQKIASGGELARFMLALKTVLAAADPVPVLVFDEVDAGIGGAVASAVGERLAGLAADVQILVVTHSPQVAARGDHHWKLAKRIEGEKTLTEATCLDRGARCEEIARMLAGTEVTEAARRAAESLLDETKSPSFRKKAKK